MTAEWIGQTLDGRYTVVALLGEGGMAAVYRAKHLQLDRWVAVKIMHRTLAADPAFTARFLREAQLNARLHHPHIIQILDYGAVEIDHLYYIVVELIEGLTLQQHLEAMADTGQRLPIADVIRISHDVADALAHAHRAGLIHLDIKPSNILLEHGQRVVVSDLGLAKLLSPTVTGGITATNTVLGTPAYMSPEQVLSQSVDARSDLYSLGVVMYQMATGTVPFHADTPIGLALKHVNEVPIPPDHIVADLPRNFSLVIQRSLLKAPEGRYQSAEELLADLDHLAVGTMLPLPNEIRQTPKQVSAAVKRSPAEQRRTSILVSLTLACLITGGILGLLRFNTNSLAQPLPTIARLPTLDIPSTPTANAPTNVLLTEAQRATEQHQASAVHVVWKTQPKQPSATHPIATATTANVTPTTLPSPTPSPTLLPTPTSTATATIPIPTPVPSPCEVRSIGATSIWVRTGPGYTYKEAGLLTPRTSKHVTGVVRDIAHNAVWWRIELSLQHPGWVAAIYVTTEGDCNIVLAIAEPTQPPSPTPIPTAPTQPADSETPIPTEIPLPSEAATPVPTDIPNNTGLPTITATPIDNGIDAPTPIDTAIPLNTAAPNGLFGKTNGWLER